MTRALITGGSGFVGQWLARALLERGWSVFGGTITGNPAPGVLSAGQIDAIRWLELDVGTEAAIASALEVSDPDWVIHLAGIAFPPDAAANPVRAFEANAVGALRLLSVVAAGPRARERRVLVVGSAEQYGAHPPDANPLHESAPLLPISTYGATKAAQEMVALQYARAGSLQVICTRSFNHSGKGQPPTYLLPALVERTRALPKHGGSLRMGNDTPVRDFLHVADVVRAYILLLERGSAGEVYNVASGEGTSIRTLAERVLKRAGVTADIVNDPALMRPADNPILVGDSSRLRAATGWRPEHSLDDIIDDLLNAATR
jgi:GDP-4-dehydro-6-deoxy-D-mannose reductase